MGGIDLRGVEAKDVRKNMCLAKANEAPKAVSKFTAKMTLIDYPSEKGIAVGRSNIICHYGVSSVPCLVEKIENVTDMNTRETFAESTILTPGQRADVTFSVEKPIIVEPLNIHPKLSKVAFRDSRMTCGWGNVIKVEHSKDEI